MSNQWYLGVPLSKMKTITTTMTLLLVTKSISHSSAFVLPTMNRIAFHTRSATKIQGSRIIGRRRSSPMEGFLSRTLCLHRREVHLPPHSRRATSNTDIVDSGNDDNRQSVTGPIYDDSTNGSPQIKLFTKEGCTLCDKVKDVRSSSDFGKHPHSNIYCLKNCCGFLNLNQCFFSL